MKKSTKPLGRRPAPGAAAQASTVVGQLRVHPEGYGFVGPHDKSDSVFVLPKNQMGAIDRDEVEVEWRPSPKGREGRIVRIVERGRTKITGTVEQRYGRAYLMPDDPRLPAPVTLADQNHGAKPGQSVVASIKSYPTSTDGRLVVSVSLLLGDPNDPRTEVQKVLACSDIEEEFPIDVAELAARMPKRVFPSDHLDRADLRDMPFVTIDPVTARDFDDAVAIEPGPDGTARLWVAVADVSHYVRETQPIDREAQVRGVSVYLPDRAIPMLPEQLSANICSLVPHQDRLAMVVQMDFDAAGTCVATDFMAAVIHSKDRLDYPGLAQAFAGQPGPRDDVYAKHLPRLEKLRDLTEKLRKRRMDRGALNLDLPEPVIDLDDDDPSRIRDVRRGKSEEGERGAYQLIEECMLAANEAVARSFEVRKEPALWRIHEPPDELKLETFVSLASSYGLKIDLEALCRPTGLKEALTAIRGHHAEQALSFQLLRSLKQASYQTDNLGHYGLASEAYLHFTSPIRRYPDLLVHRLIKRRLASQGKPAGGFPALERPPTPPDEARLAHFAQAASNRERKAMEVEREVLDIYRTLHAREHVGDIFEGRISNVTSFGAFVSLDHPFFEGLVRLDALGPDRYELDDVRLRLIGRVSGASYGLGDRITVQIVRANVEQRKIELRVPYEAEDVDENVDSDREAAPFRGAARLRSRRGT